MRRSSSSRSAFRGYCTDPIVASAWATVASVAAVTLARSYRWIAPFYDRVVSVPLRSARRASLAAIPGSGGLRILLDAVGTGLDLPLLPACHRYVGTDLVEPMLARARVHAPALDCQLVRADSMRLPFGPGCFDVVVLHLIVAVVDQPAAVLAEAARVTRPGGTLLVLDKFLRRGAPAPLRRLLSPLAGRIATRLDVVFEDVLQEVPELRLSADQPAAAAGWFRRIVLHKSA
jgi:phosphatidylethanolamine/phosphatidyl-N-methylethanolamine N-methyltransferase